MNVISNTSDLAKFCQELAKDNYVTVDTEFMRETTFWPDLCLIQLAGAEVSGVVDPLAPGLDLAPFFDLMRNPQVLKVFHAARQDVEIIVHLAGIVPKPIFDTQIAAMVCGFGDQVSYEAIVRKLAHEQVDKSSRFTDWSRRPLSDKQLSYALSDVTHLRVVYEGLKKILAENGRESWLAEDMAVLSDIETYRSHPENAWERIKIRLKSKKQLAVLMAVAAWREKEAQERNVPRSRIIKDDVIAEIAMQMPQTREALGQLRALPRGMAQSKLGDQLLAAIGQGLSVDHASLPSPRDGRPDHSDQQQAVIEILKLALKVVCEREGLAPKLVANSSDLEGLAENDTDDNPLLHGWRRDIFGNLALELKQGKALIGLRKGRVDIIRQA